MRKTVQQSKLPLILSIVTLFLLIGGSIFTNIFLFNKIEESNQKVRTLTNKLDDESTIIKETLIEIEENIKSNNKEVKDLITKLNSKLNSTTNNINSKLDKMNSTLVNIKELYESLPDSTQFSTINNKVTNLQTDVDQFLTKEDLYNFDVIIGAFERYIFNSSFTYSEAEDLSVDEQTELLNKTISLKSLVTTSIDKIKANNNDDENNLIYLDILNYSIGTLNDIITSELFDSKASYEIINNTYNNIDAIIDMLEEEIERLN